MSKQANNRQLNCAIYTRKSTDEGLDKEFNSLDAQRECAEAYIKSQTQEGWHGVCGKDRTFRHWIIGLQPMAASKEWLCDDGEVVLRSLRCGGTL